MQNYGFHRKIKQGFPFFSFFFFSFLPQFIFGIANTCGFGCFLKKTPTQQAFVAYYKLEWNVPFPTNALTC